MEFHKKADFSDYPNEKRILETEVGMYEVVLSIPNIAKYFPRLRSSSIDQNIGEIELDYLSDVTWGGPFTEHDIRLLASALDDIHTTELSSDEIQKVKAPADELLDYVFAQSEYAFDDDQKKVLFGRLFTLDDTKVTNSRGVSYFDNAQLAKEIFEYSEQYDRFDGNALLLSDLNFGNIAFSPHQAYFVDPVYLNIGKASADRATASLNILRVLMYSEKPDDKAISLACELFLDDKSGFAYTLAYCMACTTLPYRGEKDEWMDLHQELSEVGLVIWQKMYR